MGDDNIFDDDDALDYVMFEELEKNSTQKKPEKSGCFGVILILAIPCVVFSYILAHHAM